MIMPMNKNLPMLERSRLITLLSVAMPRKIVPVPANAIMIRLPPLFRPSTAPTKRASIRPMKKVKASKMGTPAALFLNLSIANMKPNAPTRNTIRPMPPVSDLLRPNCTPTQAPNTVGTIDSASSQ